MEHTPIKAAVKAMRKLLDDAVSGELFASNMNIGMKSIIESFHAPFGFFNAVTPERIFLKHARRVLTRSTNFEDPTSGQLIILWEGFITIYENQLEDKS